MHGRVRKLEDGTFTVVYYKECREESDAVIPVSCNLMPNYGHFKDGDAIEFELIEFAQEDGSFSSYARPLISITPHISHIVNENYEVITDDEEDKTLGRKFEELYQGFINGDFIATNLLKEGCVEIADKFASEFADWIRVCKLKGRGYDFDNIEELLKTYKEEKGL
jgi:hypothetical protein